MGGNREGDRGENRVERSKKEGIEWWGKQRNGWEKK